MQIPDLSGQPPWVVITVMALFFAGSIGLAWVRRRTPGGDDQALEDGQVANARPPSVEGVPSHATPNGHVDSTALVIKQALDHLAQTAEREANESQEARAESARYRAEVERLRQELIQCDRDRERAVVALESAQLRLARCNDRCKKLAQEALERGAVDDDAR